MFNLKKTHRYVEKKVDKKENRIIRPYYPTLMTFY